jgi:hypothetical protein
MAIQRTMNPKFDSVGKGSRKCWGCNTKEISQWCPYRWWPDERRPGYRFRVFRKIHLLPTCRRDNWTYPERDKFVVKYCEEAGIDYSEIVGQRKGGGGGGGRGRIAAKPLRI